MCIGNTIKSAPGDAADCSADAPCDGVTTEPNAGHTACGIYLILLRTTFSFQKISPSSLSPILKSIINYYGY